MGTYFSAVLRCMMTGESYSRALKTNEIKSELEK
jgi:hypothetical protein